MQSNIIYYLFFSIWLISLSIMPSRPICVVANDRSPFFLMTDTHTHTRITHILYPVILDKPLAVSLSWLLWIILQKNMSMQIFLWKLVAFPLAAYPEVECLGYMVVIVLIFKGFPYCFTWWLYQFTSLPTACEVSLYSMPLPTCYFLSFLQVWGDVSLWFWFAFHLWLVMLSAFSCHLTIWIYSVEKYLSIFKSDCVFAIELYEFFIFRSLTPY